MLMSPLLLDLRAGKLFLSAPCSSELRQIRSSKHHAAQTFSSWRLFVFSAPAWFLLLLPQPLPVLQDYSEMHASDVGNHPRDPAPDKHSVSNHFIFLPFLPAWSLKKGKTKKSRPKVYFLSSFPPQQNYNPQELFCAFKTQNRNCCFWHQLVANGAIKGIETFNESNSKQVLEGSFGESKVKSVKLSLWKEHSLHFRRLCVWV